MSIYKADSPNQPQRLGDRFAMALKVQNKSDRTVKAYIDSMVGHSHVKTTARQLHAH